MKSFRERITIFKLVNNNVKIDINQLIILNFIMITISLVPPVLYKILVDEVILEQKIYLLVKVVLSYIILFAIESILIYYKTYRENSIFNKLSYNIKIILFKFFIYEKNDFTGKYEVGDIKNRLDADADSVINFIDFQIVEFTTKMIQIFINICLLIIINYKLALISFLFIPISFVVSKKIKNNIYKASEEYQKIFYRYESWLQKIFLGWKEVKSLNIETTVSEEYTKKLDEFKKPFIKKTINNDLGYILSSFNNFFIRKLSIYSIGGVLVYYSMITIGQVFMFMKYFELLFENIETINKLDIDYANNKILVDRTVEFLKLYKNSKECRVNKKTISNANIKFENVSFKYPNADKFVFENVNMLINEGERVAIIGKSGNGKSTLIKLILGLYDEYDGEIYIGSDNIRNIKDTDLYSNISAVMQDAILFNMSIKDNLMISNDKATYDEIVESCKIANIHDFICTLPEGYNTIVGENGMKLSGGQRQKIAIARAIIKKAKILIFDESTSALDYESERIIIDELNKINVNKTVIIVSHREHTIKYCNRIIEIENDKIVDRII